MRLPTRPMACRWSPGVPFCHLFSSLVFGAFFDEFLRRFGRQNGARNAAQSIDFRRHVFYTLQISRIPHFEGLGPSKSCFSLGRRANVHIFMFFIAFHKKSDLGVQNDLSFDHFGHLKRSKNRGEK